MFEFGTVVVSVKKMTFYNVVLFRERKESLVSSWGLMGDLCTSVAWQESR